MQTSLRLNRLAAAAALTLTLVLVGATPVLAQTPYYWDTDGIATNATYGGSGTWDTTTANWNSGATITNTNVLVTWPGAGDNARFLRGTSGDVTVAAGGVTARTLGVGNSVGNFTSSVANYTFSGDPITLALGNFNTALTTSFGSTAVFSNAIVLAGTNVKIEINGSGVSSINFVGGISNAATVVSELKFTGFSATTGTFDVTGAITRSSTNNNFKLVVGDTNSLPSATIVKLSANNTGIGGSTSENIVNQGTLYLNHNGALGSAVGLTVANARSASNDTTAVLIGVPGVTNSKSINFASTADTNDSRTVGSDITSGTAVFSGSLTLGQFAASGIGSSLRVTAAGGGTTIISGQISDGTNTSSVTKVGVGTVILSRTNGNTHDGGTIVAAGTLLVNNTSGSGTGTGTVTVSNSATLGGTGIASGATTVNGILAPGAVATNGTFTFTSTLAVPGTARFRVFGNGINDKVLASGGNDFTGGTVEVTVDTNYTPAGGDTFDLVDGTITGSPTLNLPALGGSLVWVTNDFGATGTLSISNSGGPTNNYANWLTNYPTLTDTNGTADPDGDTFDNNREFAFDGNPTVGTPALLTAQKSGTNTVFQWVERNNPPGGAAYVVKGTTNLSAGPWTNASVTISNATDQGGINLPADYTRKEFVVPGAGNQFYKVEAGVTNAP